MPRGQLFLDNGGYSVKALYLPAHRHRSQAADAAPPPAPVVLVVPNCVGAAVHAGTGILGDQLDRLPHYHGLMVRRPVDRGFVVDGGLQARVWEHILQRLAIESEEELDVWLTVPFAAPKAVAQLLLLLCTRSFRFGSVTLVSSSFLTLLAHTFAADVTRDVCESKAVTAAPAAQGAPQAVQEGSSSDGSSAARKRHRSEEAAETATGSSRGTEAGVALVVDVGFSGTTVVPYVDFLPVHSSVARLDVGGKLLTNRLKEVLSFAQMNVMEDTWLINHVKERCCAVATDPRRALHHCATLWHGKTREEVEEALDAAAKTEKGGVRACVHDAARRPLRFYLPTIPALLPLGVVEAELPTRLPRTSAVDTHALQHLLLCQERFLIPELLFAPADVGLDQQGLSQVVTEGVFQRGLLQHVTSLLRPTLLRNVCVYGGTAALPNLRVRLEADVAAATAVSADVPSTDATRVRLAAAPPLPSLLQRSSGSSAASDAALQPVLGAWCLLTAAAGDVSASAGELVRLRALVQQRCTIELQRPPAGRVTVENFQLALQCLL